MLIASLANPGAAPCQTASPETEIKSVSRELGSGLPFVPGSQV